MLRPLLIGQFAFDSSSVRVFFHPLLFLSYNSRSISHQPNSGRKARSTSGCFCPSQRFALFCSHSRKNSNGKEILSKCTAAELIIVNGVRGERFFDSGCTRDSFRDIDGGDLLSTFSHARLRSSVSCRVYTLMKRRMVVTTISFFFRGPGFLRFHVRQRHMTPKLDSNLVQTDRRVGVLLDHLLRTRD